jgi:hypothetical protein
LDGKHNMSILCGGREHSTSVFLLSLCKIPMESVAGYLQYTMSNGYQ